MPPSILHHAAIQHRGGAVRVARLLLAAQKAAGLDAQLSFEVAENDPETLGAPVGAIPACPGPAELPTPPAALAGRASRLPPDGLVHLHTSTDWPVLLESLLDSNASLGLVLTLHDATALTGGCTYPLDCPHFPACAEPCPRLFPQARLRQAHILRLLRRLGPQLVSPSRWLAGLAKAVLPELPLRVIPNGVPWSETLTPRLEARSALGMAPGARVALFAAHGGTRASYKSGFAWPEYWTRIASRLPGSLGVAVGGSALDNQDGLMVWPYLDRAKLALLMRAADCLVYPTLADNHPLVLLEAAAQELPVASFNVGGVPEIVRHGETGLLAPAGDGATLIDHVVALLSTPILARTLGRTARDQGSRRFNTERMAEDYRKLLRDASGGQGA
ncbi:MAG: glycosyl transferase family 1 [Desulfovibrio sp.]|nr:glycosyl transferase family 1 [Desulfovibrio sp.]